MQWTRSDTIGLAKASCTHCQGLGLRTVRGGRETACNCVYREIFRACYHRFRECAVKEKYLSRITLERCNGRDTRQTFSRKTEDYLADFCLISRRHLDAFDYQVFKFHFLLGADWKLCCRQMKIDRGNFFHAVYRIEQQLGKVFRELEPYGIFPIDEYFNGKIQKEKTAPAPVRARPPLCVFPLRPEARPNAA